MTSDLKGKTAIVTGAARGLGLVIVEDLAREGMRVAGVDVKSEELARGMADVAERHGVETLAFPADVGDEKAVKHLTADVRRRWGRIDVLVNNAGIRQIAPVWETSTAMWDRIHGANLKGPF